MNTPQTADARAVQPTGKKMLWRLLAALLVLATLAVGVNVFWWLSRPGLEPLPSVPAERLEPEVSEVLTSATANVAKDDRSAQAWGDLGAVYFAHTFEAQSQICFRNAERLDPKDYRWPYLLGVSLIYTDGDQMLAAYRRAADLCGERSHVQLRLAEALLDRGELEDAAAQIQRILVYAASNPRAQLAKARLLVAQGKLQEAKTWAEKSVAGAADKRAPQMLLAQLCRRTQDAAGEAKAVEALEQIPDGFTSWEDPDIENMLKLSRDRASRLARAEELARQGDAATGKGILFEMTRGNDGSSAAAMLAKTLNREGKSQDAEALARGQIAASPNDERLWFQLGVACFQQQRYPDAEAAFRRVIELKPDYSDAQYNLALTLLKVEKPDDALAVFATAVRISPSNASARLNLAELLLAKGNLAAAQEHLEAVAKLAPEEPRVRKLLERIKAGKK